MPKISLRTWLEITGLVALGVYAWLWHSRPTIPEVEKNTRIVETGDVKLTGTITGGTTVVKPDGSVENTGGTVVFGTESRFTKSTTGHEVSRPPVRPSAFRPTPWRGFLYVGAVAPEHHSLELGLGIRLWTWWRFHFGILVGYETMSYGDYRMRELKAAALVGL